MEEVIVGDRHDETVGHLDNPGQKHSCESHSTKWDLKVKEGKVA